MQYSGNGMVIKMITYGKYIGNLDVILRQNPEGYLLLDIHNKGGNRVRFITSVTNENFPKDFLKKATAEDWIDALLDNVVKGYYKKHFFSFSKRLEDDILLSMIKLTKTHYKDNDAIWQG